MVSHAFWANQCTKHFHAAHESGIEGVSGKCFIFYLDDILIFRKKLEENMMHFCKVLESLSPCILPTVLAQKKNIEWKICTDS